MKTPTSFKAELIANIFREFVRSELKNNGVEYCSKVYRRDKGFILSKEEFVIKNNLNREIYVDVDIVDTGHHVVICTLNWVYVLRENDRAELIETIKKKLADHINDLKKRKLMKRKDFVKIYTCQGVCKVYRIHVAHTVPMITEGKFWVR